MVIERKWVQLLGWMMRDGLDWIFRLLGKEGCLAAEAEGRVKELNG